jgi:hypothetical protein
MDACRKAGLMKIVCSAILPTFRTERDTKFAPLTVNVKLPLPATTDSGDVELIWGVGLVTGLITNVSAWVVPPPGAGVVTVMLAVPGFWINDAGICTVRIFVFKNIAASDEPFQATVDAGVKLYPVTVSLNVGCPAEMPVGDIDEIVGAG